MLSGPEVGFFWRIAMLFEQHDRFKEQRLAEDAVAYVMRGLDVLHPLTRAVVLEYLQRQVDRLTREMNNVKT